MSSLAEGIAERARMEEIVKSIRNFMETLDLIAQQAIDALKVPVSEQGRYAALV